MAPAKGLTLYTFDEDAQEKSNFDNVSVHALAANEPVQGDAAVDLV